MELDRVVLSLEEGRNFSSSSLRRKGIEVRHSDNLKTQAPRSDRVMIRCAESGEGVPTGVRIDPASFKISDRSEHTFKCPHCLREHTWSMSDAWTEAGAC